MSKPSTATTTGNDGYLEIVKGLTFSIALRQYMHATNTTTDSLDADTVNAIRATSDPVAESVYGGGESKPSIETIIKAAISAEIERMTTTGTIPAASARKYKLDISMFGSDSMPLPTLKSHPPEAYSMPNTKIAKSLTDDLVGAGLIEFVMSSADAKKPVVTTCMMAYEGENIQLKGRTPYSEYDQAVYNAIVSLFVDGDQNHTFTADMVYRAMNGLHNSEDPSHAQEAKIIESIDKMRFTRAVIDCSEELRQRRTTINGEIITSGKIDTYLLNASTVTVSTGNTTKTAYKLNSTPVLYQHALISRQILRCPSYLLDTRRVSTNTERVIAVRNYLLRRIYEMKSGGVAQRSIAFGSYDRDGIHHAGIYERAGLANPSKAEAKRIRDMVFSLLDFYSGKTSDLGGEPIIKGYAAYTEKHSIKGITIDL